MIREYMRSGRRAAEVSRVVSLTGMCCSGSNVSPHLATRRSILMIGRMTDTASLEIHEELGRRGANTGAGNMNARAWMTSRYVPRTYALNARWPGSSIAWSIERSGSAPRAWVVLPKRKERSPGTVRCLTDYGRNWRKRSALRRIFSDWPATTSFFWHWHCSRQNA